jgi:ubiquinol-cytochrome c reductase cytochrome c subunit
VTTARSLASAGAALAARRRHPLAGAVLVLLALVVTGGLYAAFTSTGAASAASTDDPSQTSRGRQLYLEGCSSCHGLNAQGVTVQDASTVDSTGPSLVGVGAAAVDFQVGTGRMPAAQPGPQVEQKQRQYTQPEIDALAAYIASLGPGPAVPSSEDLAGVSDADLQAGGELFRTNCSQCHNFAGAGGALGQGKFAPPLKNTTPQHIWEAMLTGPQSMPVFNDGTMPPEQKQQIIKYIEGVRAEPNPGGMALGRLGPVSEGLFIWIVGLGAVTAVAVWIGVRSS